MYTSPYKTDRIFKQVFNQFFGLYYGWVAMRKVESLSVINQRVKNLQRHVSEHPRDLVAQGLLSGLIFIKDNSGLLSNEEQEKGILDSVPEALRERYLNDLNKSIEKRKSRKQTLPEEPTEVRVAVS